MRRVKRRARGHIEQLRSGSYRAIVYAGIDPLTGRRRDLKATAATYDEAEKALTRLQQQVDEQRQPKASITLGQAIAKWLEVADHEELTRERIEDLIRLYIAPRLGDLPAGKLDAELLERFYARLLKCRELCAGRPRAGHECRPLSSSTVRKIHYIIRPALALAVRWKYLPANPAAQVEAPSPNETEPDPPSPAEAAAILNEAWRDPEWGLFLWLTMITGSRRGEMSALCWRDIHFDRALLEVPASIAQTKRHGLVKKKTKTRRARRMALDPHTLALLAEHRDRWREQCAALGVELSADAYLFSPSPDGAEPYVPHTFSQRYARMAKRLKLRSTRLHSLRHYNATELVAAGVDLRTVAGRLGHGNGGATTLKVYAAWVDHADRKAAETIAQLMPKPVPAPRAPRGPYETIAADLRARIESGELKPGDQLPTVVQLAATYGVAAGTVNRAMTVLRETGAIEVSRGRRAVVRDRSRGFNLDLPSLVTEDQQSLPVRN